MQTITLDIPALLAFHRQTFGPARMENDPEPPPAPDAPPAPEPEKTFTQAELDRIVADRVKRAKPADYDDLKSKAQQYDSLAAASQTEQERAVEAAKAQAKTDALIEAAPRLVSAEFRAAAKGVLSDEARDALLEDLDLTKYLTDKGEVDVERVEKKVAAVAGGRPTATDLGQGVRTANKPDPGPGINRMRAAYATTSKTP